MLVYNAVVRVCRTCEEPYPPTSEYFYKLRGGNGKLYLAHICKRCRREDMAQRWATRGHVYNARRAS